MPTYDGTAVVGGRERSVIVTTKVGLNYPVFAYSNIPLSDDGKRSTGVGCW